MKSKLLPYLQIQPKNLAYGAFVYYRENQHAIT